MSESKIVSAVGIAVSSTFGGPELASAIEKAMSQAVLQANAEGISTEEKNSVELKRRMEEAKQKVLDNWKVFNG